MKIKKIERHILVVFVIGILSGILLWGGLHTAVEQTNTMEFCVSCHEMGQVFEEYKQSPHYQERGGCAHNLRRLPRAQTLGAENGA